MNSHNYELKKRIAEFLELTFKSNDKFLIEIVLDRLLWTATEDNDQNERVKYLGQPYWSHSAVSQYQKQNQDRKNKNFEDLRHEHIVPRNLIKKMILELEQKNANKILEVLNRYSHAVIVTKSEDKKLRGMGLNKKMPQPLDALGDIKSRYYEANIKIIDVKGKALKDPSLLFLDGL